MPDALNYCIIFTDYNIIHRLITNASLCGKRKNIWAINHLLKDQRNPVG